MLKSIEVQNFQSHKSTLLNLTEGVNIIVGNSDSGKTAIIRALNKLIWNRPLGNDFQSYWGGNTLITVETMEGNTVMLEITEGGKVKRYTLNGTDFKAFGTDVPEEIKSCLNLSEINLQAQFDRPFLLDSAPGEVATHFNKIAHLDQIDKAIQKVNSWVYNLQQLIGHEPEKNKPATGLIRELKTLEEQLEAFPDLNKMEVEIEVLEGLKESQQNKINTLSKLKSIIKNITVTEQQIKSKSEILQHEKTVQEITQVIEKNNLNKQNLFNLQNIIKKYNATEKQIKTKKNLILLEKDVNFINGIILELNKAIEVKKSLKNQLSLLNNTFILLKKKMAEIEGKEAVFKREMPSVCPLCGNETKKK